MFRFSPRDQFGTVMETGCTFDLAFGAGFRAFLEMIVVMTMFAITGVPIASSFAATFFPISPVVVPVIRSMYCCLCCQQTARRGSNRTQSMSTIHGFPLSCMKLS